MPFLLAIDEHNVRHTAEVEQVTSECMEPNEKQIIFQCMESNAEQVIFECMEANKENVEKCGDRLDTNCREDGAYFVDGSQTINIVKDNDCVTFMTNVKCREELNTGRICFASRIMFASTLTRCTLRERGKYFDKY